MAVLHDGGTPFAAFLADLLKYTFAGISNFSFFTLDIFSKIGYNST